MSAVKCPNCGLSTFSADTNCRRCGKLVYRPTSRVVSDKPPIRNSIISLAIFAALCVGGYYVFSAMQSSVQQYSDEDAKRAAAQPSVPESQKAFSRTADDRMRAQRVGNAVNISPALAEHKDRVKETEKMMNSISNSSSQ